MALVPRKVIARLVSVSGGDPAELSWEWILRANGQVYCRLTGIDGHWEPKAVDAGYPAARGRNAHAAGNPRAGCRATRRTRP